MPPPLHSALYEGLVRHHRRTPRDHAFAYRVAMVYLDLDELEQVFALPGLGDGVMSQHDAVANVRSSLSAAAVEVTCTDEEMWRILRFWSRVGDIFV